MWGLLSDPGHAESFDHLGEAYAPMRRLVEQLVRREYADRVYGVKSMATFGLTTAPTYAEADGHDRIGIEYNPDSGLFAAGRPRVGFARQAKSARSSTATSCGCCSRDGQRRPNRSHGQPS